MFESSTARRFFLSCLVLGLGYRIHLYRFTLTGAVGPFALHFEGLRIWNNLLDEPLFAAGVTLGLWVPHRLLTRRRGGASSSRWRAAEQAAASLLLIALGIIYGLQHRLLDVMNTGLTFELFQEAWGAVPAEILLAQASWVDLVYVVGPAALFLALGRIGGRARRLLDGGVILALAAVLVIGWTHSDGIDVPDSASSLTRNPVLFVASEVVRGLLRGSEPVFPAGPAWGAPQATTVRLIDPVFGLSSPPSRRATCTPPATGGRWNILVVVMESVGSVYAFDTQEGNETPMPALASLAKRGLTLSAHHSTNNSSPRSIFSIFSGLLPLPRPRMFSTTNHVHVPSLFTFLGSGYDSFLVSAGPLRWYFPYGFLANTGLRELVGAGDIHPAHPRDSGSSAIVHELDAVDYFLGRLERAQRPFAAVYYSYVPHFPYRDHGDAYAVFPNAETPRHRYYNNLRLLDTQIRRIMDALRQSGTLDDTIVLFIGDHGEAFGQHAGNHIHLNFSYEENVRPLAVLFQPRLFRPSVETRYTSHVDVLPTLLDAVCVPYEPRLLQGHSLLAGWDRRAIYLYGSEHSVTSISKDGLKVTTDHRSGQAWAYDLRADPEEKHRLGISVEHPQVRANLQLYLFQAQMLPAYNESARNGRAFHGLRHPLQ